MERIDVHVHAIPRKYRQYLIDNGHQNPDGMPAIPQWNPDGHINLMKKLNISRSILSISSPGTHLTPTNHTLATSMTRQFNEELSSICSANASHFSFFASLPLPSIAESIAEIDYALDKLGAVGFALMSNANGVYLGDKALDPIFAKLNERKAIIFMHPTTCNLIVGTEMQTVTPLGQFPRPMMEFMFDETRAVTNLLLSGTVSKYPDIKFIMSHCGCLLPPLLSRIGAFSAMLGAGGNRNDEFRKLLRERFFFDLAGFPFPDQIQGLMGVLGDDGEKRLVYGSDYPFTPEGTASMLAAQMDKGCEKLFSVEQRKSVYYGNAKRLFGLPRGDVHL